MNRRNFLKGSVGAAVAVALGRSFVEPVEAVPPGIAKTPASAARINAYFTSKDAWFIKGNPAGLKTYWRGNQLVAEPISHEQMYGLPPRDLCEQSIADLVAHIKKRHSEGYPPISIMPTHVIYGSSG